MTKLFKIIFLLLSLTLIQCSSDDNTSESLMMNGTEFKPGSGRIKSEGQNAVWFTIKENKAEGARVISVYASHASGSHTGTYVLDNDMIEAGIAVIAILDETEEHQISGGSDFSPPSGTLTIVDYGNRRMKVTFNDVILDGGLESETTISGSCTKTFTSGN